MSRSGDEWGRGFTLVELLVVLAVITLLAAFLLPVLFHAREDGLRTACLSQLGQLSKAHLLYLQDWDERFPDWYQDAPPRPDPFGPYRFWPEYFQPYLRHQAIFRDAGAVRQVRVVTWLADYALTTWSPESPSARPGGKGTQADPYYHWPGPPLSLGQVPRVAETINLTDGYTSTRIIAQDLRRHGAGMNVSFLDGHARWLPEGEFLRVSTDGRGFYWFHYATADR